jgi:GNAT superfamily N-acetyltransferase
VNAANYPALPGRNCARLDVEDALLKAQLSVWIQPLKNPSKSELKIGLAVEDRTLLRQFVHRLRRDRHDAGHDRIIPNVGQTVAARATVSVRAYEQPAPQHTSLVAGALDAVVDRALAAGDLDTFDDEAKPRDRLVAAQEDILLAFVDAVGGQAERKESPEADQNITAHLHMHGFSPLDTFLGRPAPHMGKLRVEAGRQTFALGDNDRDRRFIGHIRDLWLPSELQRQGYGHQLVTAFMRLWTAMGVELVAATAVRDAGAAAFQKWGFVSEGEDGNGAAMFSYRLTKPFSG